MMNLLLAQLLTWGPYLRDLEDGAVRVQLELAAPRTAQAFALDVQTSELLCGHPAVGTLPQVFLSGLAPGRLYAWSVRLQDSAGGTSWVGGPWYVRPPASAGYRACAWGDNQNDVGAAFRPLVARMVDEGAELLVGLGDYIQNAEDVAEWQRLFASPVGPLLRFLPVLGCRGNHDGEGPVARSRWTVAGGAGQWGAVTLGPVRWVILDSNQDTLELRLSMRPGGAQRAFLEAEAATWALPGAPPLRIALWHAPALTERWDGGCYYPPDPDWISAMDYLAAHGCTLVMNGHAHAYQRGAWSGMPWIISGGGGGALDVPICFEVPQITFTAAEHHILSLDVSSTRATVRAVRANGTELDRVEAPAR